MPEISDFQRTNFGFAKSEQKYPVNTHTNIPFRAKFIPTACTITNAIFRKKLTKFDPWSPAIEPWYPGVV
jgi:hypothetical protein